MATPLQTTKCWDIGGAISTYESYDAEESQRSFHVFGGAVGLSLLALR